MFTHDGFKLKECRFDESQIILDGNAYPIQSIKEVSNFKSRFYFVMVIQTILTVTLLILGYLAFVGITESTIFRDRVVFQGIMFVVIFSFFCTWIPIIKFLPKPSLRSCWLINGKGVYIEHSDDVNIEYKLKNTAMVLPKYDLEEDSFNVYNLKINKKELAIRIALFITSLFIIFGGINGYIGKGLFLVTINIFIILAVGFKLYDLKRQAYDKLKWKKNTI